MTVSFEKGQGYPCWDECEKQKAKKINKLCFLR